MPPSCTPKWGCHVKRRSTTSVDTLLPLELLRPGEWAEVADVTGEPGWVARLAELGLRVGEQVQMVRAGSPCLFAVEGSRFSLRGDEAMMVLVRPLG